MSGLICGIDIGTTNLKVALMDEAGRIRWTRAVPTPRAADALGPVTDAAALVAQLEDLVIEGWRSVGGRRPIRAIAAAGVGEDGMRVAPDLSPLEPVLAWFDTRADAEALELRDGPAASPRLGIAVDPMRTAAKWLWLARHRPLEAADAALWITLTDYPAVVWSGRPFMSQTLATRTAAYDVPARRWDGAMLAAARAPRLPEILVAGSVVGPVRHGRLLAEGAASADTLVVAGGHDHPVAASVVRRFDANAIVDSMGTAELVYGEVDADASLDFDPLIAFSVPIRGNEGIACVGVFELAAALEPWRASPHGDLVAELLSAPALPGDPSPPALIEAVTRDGTIASALAKADRGEALRLTRATLEAATMRGLRMIEATRARGSPAGAIFVTGGWSRSNAFVELRASIFGTRLFRLGDEELTATGAAVLAAEAVEATIARGMMRPEAERIEPRAEWIEPYRRLYARLHPAPGVPATQGNAAPIPPQSRETASWQS